MKRHGTKKISTKVQGHQNCGDCHPPQKAHQARARRADRREIEQQLGPVAQEIERWFAKPEVAGAIPAGVTEETTLP